MKWLWNFFKSVIYEMKLVVWPNAKQTRNDTLTVIGMTVFFTIFLGVIDWAVETLFVHMN